LVALPPQLDPMCRSVEAILMRWHREVWYFEHPHPSHPDVLHPGKLQEAVAVDGAQDQKGREGGPQRPPDGQLNSWGGHG